MKAASLRLRMAVEYEDAGISSGFLLTRPEMRTALADISLCRSASATSPLPTQAPPHPCCWNLPAAVVEMLDKKALSAAVLETGETLPFASFQAAEEVFFVK